MSLLIQPIQHQIYSTPETAGSLAFSGAETAGALAFSGAETAGSMACSSSDSSSCGFSAIA